MLCFSNIIAFNFPLDAGKISLQFLVTRQLNLGIYTNEFLKIFFWEVVISPSNEMLNGLG